MKTSATIVFAVVAATYTAMPVSADEGGMKNAMPQENAQANAMPKEGANDKEFFGYYGRGPYYGFGYPGYGYGGFGPYGFGW